jgi:hypothetical protein
LNISLAAVAKKITGLYENENSIADASSTINSRLGNRLDWNEVATAARLLLAKLPAGYYPARDDRAAVLLPPSAAPQF